MRLEKLVLHGFKSFADKITFEFNKDFISVVGPNGSGKSNVADAIRWVLGEQSMKLLRGKTATDLIFGGSDKLAKMGMAQVELHLDNSDGTFPVEYQEVVLARKLFRDGESEYTLNGSKVRLQDVVMMLAQARFGQKSYAVIGQGMITQFLSATPQDRKDFFDEATGVKEFQIKRDRAINKLIRTEENLVQGEALLVEIEPHLRSLERQVKKLEKREKLEEELQEVQRDYYGSLWHELQQDILAQKTRYGQLEEEARGVDAQLNEKQAVVDAMAAEASRGERYEQLQHQFNILLEKKSYLLKEQAVLKGKLEVEHERQGELSLVWLQRKEDEITQDAQTHESEKLILQDKIKREEVELARRQKTLASLQAEFREEEYAVLQLKEQIEREMHAMTVPEIQVELQELFANHEDFLKDLLNTATMDEFRQVQVRAKQWAKQFAEFMDKLTADDKSTVEALRVEMRQKEQLLARLIQERETEQQAVNRLQVSIESARTQSAILHKQLERLQAELSQVRGDINEAEDRKSDDGRNKQAALYTQQLNQYEQEIAQFDTQLAGIRGEIDEFNVAEEEKKTRLVAAQSEMRSLQRKLNNLQQEMNGVDVNMARLETRMDDVQLEINRDVAETLHAAIYQFASQHPVDRVELQRRMLSLQRQLASIGEIDQATVDEYNETKDRFDFLTDQTTDLQKSIEQLEVIIDELDATIKKQFNKNFKIINEGFQNYFQVLFNGGKAKLEMLTDDGEDDKKEAEAAAGDVQGVAEDVSGESLHDEKERELIGKKKKKQKVVSGIDVIASPPGKKVKNVNALSGGEKSMVSIALICAIIAHNPSPFVFLDEVEAALDEENSEKLAAILRDLSTKTQIICITHNRVTMRASDLLYGVTVGKEGKSHILSVELEQAEEMVGAE